MGGGWEKKGEGVNSRMPECTHIYSIANNPVVSGNSETHYIRTLVERISPVNS